ncbi:MAG: hypothetical protein AABY01_02980 [Nanoarchaeota archaeon]
MTINSTDLLLEEVLRRVKRDITRVTAGLPIEVLALKWTSGSNDQRYTRDASAWRDSDIIWVYAKTTEQQDNSTKYVSFLNEELFDMTPAQFTQAYEAGAAQHVKELRLKFAKENKE